MQRARTAFPRDPVDPVDPVDPLMSSENADLDVNMHTSSLTSSPIFIKIQASTPRQPQGTPRCPKGPQKAPQGTPRHPQAAQMTSKGAPKGAPRRPKGPKRRPEGGPRHPKATQGAPKAPQDIYKETLDQPPKRPLCYYMYICNLHKQTLDSTLLGVR